MASFLLAIMKICLVIIACGVVPVGVLVFIFAAVLKLFDR